MLLLNCKVKLKLKQTNYYVLALNGAGNTNVNSNTIIFTIKDTKVFVPMSLYQQKSTKKPSKIPSKGFERSVCWNEYKKNNK